MRVKCPACSAEMDLDVLLAHEEGRHVLADLVRLGVPMGALLLRYVALFRPAKRALAMSRTLALLAELWPDMQRGAITRKGRDWSTTPAQWHQAIETVLAARDKGALMLPLTSHGYLYEVLLGLVDKDERQAEKAREQQQRGRAHSAGLMSIEASFGSDELAGEGTVAVRPAQVEPEPRHASPALQPAAAPSGPSLEVLANLAKARKALAEKAAGAALAATAKTDSPSTGDQP